MALHNPGDYETSVMRVDDAIAMAGNVAMLQAQVEAMTRNVTEMRRQLDAANERNRTLAEDLARVTLENAAMASALSKANHTADELRYQLSLASRADEGMAMRALRAAATQAGIVAIACEFSEGSITLTEAINRAQALGDAAPVLSLTDRGAGDGYCAYDEGVE